MRGQPLTFARHPARESSHGKKDKPFRMKWTKIMSGKIARTCGFLLIANTLSAGDLPFGTDRFITGSIEFRTSCASCHGIDGRGNGPVSKFLTPKPSDLTLLTKRNGGEYPFLEVFKMIDGREEVAAHGDREMPVWGNRYRLEEAAKEYGWVPIEEIVMGRILALVYAIQLIQQK
jgi:mono/diheme cytochrome c family protein